MADTANLRRELEMTKKKAHEAYHLYLDMEAYQECLEDIHYLEEQIMEIEAPPLPDYLR